jgi:hypothetical protein
MDQQPKKKPSRTIPPEDIVAYAIQILIIGLLIYVTSWLMR